MPKKGKGLEPCFTKTKKDGSKYTTCVGKQKTDKKFAKEMKGLKAGGVPVKKRKSTGGMGFYKGKPIIAFGKKGEPPITESSKKKPKAKPKAKPKELSVKEYNKKYSRISNKKAESLLKSSKIENEKIALRTLLKARKLMRKKMDDADQKDYIFPWE